MKKLLTILILFPLFLSCSDNDYTTYSIILSATDGGTVKGSSNVTKGGSCTIEAIPSDDFGFKGWYTSDALISRDEVFTFTPDGDKEFKAVFSSDLVNVRIYTITPNGEYILNERLNFEKNSTKTFTAQSEKEWFFAGWYDELGAKINSNTAYSISITVHSNTKLFKKYQR